MMRRNYIKFLPIVIVVIVVVVFLVYNNHPNNRFYIEKVNSKVVKRSNWQLRTTEFYLKNGLMIDSTGILPLNIKVGDSISKEANTQKFNVYRKNRANKFKLHKVYKKL